MVNLLVPVETSSGLRKNCDDRSERVEGAGSWMTTDCQCVWGGVEYHIPYVAGIFHEIKNSLNLKSGDFRE